MADMPDNLARFERLARRAAERREAEEMAERKESQSHWDEEVRLAHESPEHLAGPPDGCRACYGWDYNLKFHPPWAWRHQAPIDPEERLVDLYGDGDPFEVEFCTHACHGPEGLALPMIALA